jgi:quinol monooxygenase YgiN
MIIILATVAVRPGQLEEALQESQEHVLRSRAEPGCIAHGVHQAYEDPNRLTFVEQWVDREAMNTHFAVPAARAFARRLGELSDQPSELKIYEAEPLI